MLEKHQQPITSPRVLSYSEQRNLSLSLRALVRWKGLDPLDSTPQRLNTLFDQYFGLQSTVAWANQEQRGAVLMDFLESIKRETFTSAQANRDSGSPASIFFGRVDNELRELIPLFDTSQKIRLFRSCYPLGSGVDSLTELCVTNELCRHGASGVINLFAQLHQEGITENDWTKDLVRAANRVLPVLSPKLFDRYLKVLKLVFSPTSPWAPRAKEIFSGMSSSVPLDAIIEVYGRVRPMPQVAVELKQAVLAEVLDALAHSTGELFAPELLALRSADGLPPITNAIVAPSQRIADSRCASHRIAPTDLARVKRLLTMWAFKTTPIKSHVHPPFPPKDVPQEGANANASREDIAGKLKELRGDRLRAYLSALFEREMANPGSELLHQIPLRLEGVGVENLLIIQSSLTSFDISASEPLRSIPGIIHEHLSTIARSSTAEELVDLYLLCVKMDAPHEELWIIKKALRTRLHLPLPKDPSETLPLTDCGQRVWRWIFSDMPPDGALLNDLFRVHLDRIFAHTALTLWTESGPGSILDAVLDYSRELKLLESYKPGPRLQGVGIWRLVHFTAEVQQQIGNKYRLIPKLLNSIRKLLLTKEGVSDDAFPRKWSEGSPGAQIKSICGAIRESITQNHQSPSFEEMTLLVSNSLLLARRGPPDFARIFSYARTHFIEAMMQMSPIQIRELHTDALVRIVQGLASSRFRKLDILDILAEECVKRSEVLSLQQCAAVAEAFALLRVGHQSFWSKFASLVEENWEAFCTEKLLSSLWSLALEAPDKMPACFDASILHPRVPSPFPQRITQTLITLGRYTPTTSDRAFQQLLAVDIPHKMSLQESKFMQALPSALGVAPEAIVPQVVVGGFETDFLVDFGHRRLIIELDGGRHFLSGPNGGMLLGGDAFQDRVFRMLGYEVFHFPVTALADSNTSRPIFAELAALVETLKGTARDPNAFPKVYLEDLRSRRSNEGGS